MLISELLEILGEAQGKYGDVEVLLDPDSDVNGLYHYCRVVGNPYLSASKGGRSLYIQIAIS